MAYKDLYEENARYLRTNETEFNKEVASLIGNVNVYEKLVNSYKSQTTYDLSDYYQLTKDLENYN